MMMIFINGESQQVEDDTTIEQLLANLELSNKRLAVEINQDIVPRSEFPNYTFNEQDKVEIVQAIGGGTV